MNNATFLYNAANAYQELSGFYKLSYIRKLPNGKYRVFSSKGRNLGTYDSMKAAKKRLKNVEMFKHMKRLKKKASVEIDLSNIEDFSYSAIMRQINKQVGESVCRDFAEIYKKYFDQYVLDNDKDAEEKSLADTLKDFSDMYALKGSFEKTAANASNEAMVAKYLSHIIQFSLGKIPQEKRQKSLQKVKTKIGKLDINDIATKKMPSSAAIGQSITFIKHTLFGQNPQYIKNVIQYLLRYL